MDGFESKTRDGFEKGGTAFKEKTGDGFQPRFALKAVPRSKQNEGRL